jgi:hypothetical protein
VNVLILNVLNKDGQSFTNELGRQWLVNTSAVSNVAPKSLTSTSLTFLPDPRWPTTPQKWIVENDIATINQSLAGAYNGGTVPLTPSYINGKANTIEYQVQVNDIRYAVADGGNVLVYILKLGRLDLDKWRFDSTTLTAIAQIVNGALNNHPYSGTFGACSTSTQAATFVINQAGSILLEADNGGGWVTIDSDTVTAATTSNTFSFPPGDLVSGQGMRLSLKVGAVITPIVTGTFGCAGGSGSGSGATGDCNMYAYFDGDGWNDTLNTLNWGETCTSGYHLQVSTSSDFTNEDAYIIDDNLQGTLHPFTLTAGTYYARVRNISGQTRYSPTLTFTAS